jgi:large subunit ribosomal protein L9
MKVILRANVEGVGNTGDLVDVANGYAQNFLMPKGLAMRATEGAQPRQRPCSVHKSCEA